MGGKALDPVMQRRSSIKFDLLAVKKQIEGLAASQRDSPVKKQATSETINGQGSNVFDNYIVQKMYK